MTINGVKGPVNPWLKFYPSDWRADPALRMCSIAARGLWIEILCVMHEAEPRGSLRINGRPVSPAQLTSLASCGDVNPLLQELEDAGVFSRDEEGVILSRRMMRDAEKAAQDKANGRKGGNPLVKGGVNPPDNLGVKDADNRQVKAQKPEARSHLPEQPPPSAPQGDRAAELFAVLVDTFPASPHTHVDKARKWFAKQTEEDQRSITAAAASFSAWFWTSQRSKGRAEAEALSFAPGLHSWMIEGGWKSVSQIPTASPVEQMERLDRVRDEELWLACERIQGKSAPTSDNSWSFRKVVVDKARRDIAGDFAA